MDTLDARGGCQAGCALVRELLDAHEIQAVRDELAATAAELRAYTDAQVAALRAETQAALAVLSARATALEVALQAEVADREAGDAALDSKIDEEVTRLVKVVCSHDYPSATCLHACMHAYVCVHTCSAPNPR